MHIAELKDAMTTTTSMEEGPLFRFLASPRKWDVSSQGELYCRQKEQHLIQEVYNRMRQQSSGEQKTEFVVIKGPIGVGKTALARSVDDTVKINYGYFLSGKFERSPKPVPYSAFVSALSSFSRLVLERGESHVAAVRTQVRSHIRTDLNMLIRMVPSLQAIFDDVPGTAPHEDQLWLDSTNRIQYLIRLFMNAISSRETPVVFFLDDLHWADNASLDLLHSLLLDNSNQRILYLATCRDDLLMSNETLQKLVTRLDEEQINRSIIDLNNFTVEDLRFAISQLLGQSSDILEPLTNAIYTQTDGNIFFVKQCIRYLINENKIVLDGTNMHEIQLDTGEGKETTIYDYITLKIRQFPEISQQILKCAASLGSKWDERVLQRLFIEDLSENLNAFIHYGLVEKDEDNCWKFTHDVFHEATYALIKVDDRQEFHYELGLRLWTNLSLEELDKYCTTVVDQLLFGTELMVNKEEKIAVAKLCFRAGEKSVESSFFRSAFGYLTQGIVLLNSSRCWRDEYKFTLNCYNATAEVASCVGEFDTAIQLINETVKNARSFDDTLQAQELKVRALGTSGRILEAIDLGYSILKNLGEKFTPRRCWAKLYIEIQQLRRLFNSKSDETILNLPLMVNPRKLAAMKIMGMFCLYVFMVDECRAAMIVVRMAKLTLKYGQSALSPIGINSFGSCLCRFGNYIQEGFRMNRLGLAIYEKFGLSNWMARCYLDVYGTSIGLQFSSQTCIDSLREAYLVSLEKGDVEYAFLNWAISTFYQMQTTRLSDVLMDVVAQSKQMALYGQEHVLIMMQPLTLVLQLMTRESTDKAVLNDSEFEKIPLMSNKIVIWIHQYRMMVSYLFGDYEQAYFHSTMCFAPLLESCFAQADLMFLLFFIGLSSVEHARLHKKTHSRAISRCLRIFRRFSQQAPATVMSRQLLLEAEVATLKNDHTRAFENYIGAITHAKKAGFVMETALCNERAGRLAFKVGDFEMSREFYRESLEYYERWGAAPKVLNLTNEIRNQFGSNRCLETAE